MSAGIPEAAGAIDLVDVDAARTRETLELALAGFAAPPRCLIEDELYLADRSRLILRLQRLCDSDNNVLVIGHNPGLHELALALAEPGAPARARSRAESFRLRRAPAFASPRVVGAGLGRHQLVRYETVGSRSGNKG